MSTKPNPSPDPIFTLRGHNAEVHAVKFSVSGEKLISGSVDGEVRVWNTNTKKCLYATNAHAETVLSLHTLQENKILSQGREGVCKVWHVRDSNMENVISVQTHSFSFGKCDAHESANGYMLASPSAIDPSRIEVWDLKSSQVTHAIGAADTEKLGLCMCIKILADTPHIVCAGFENGNIHWWDLRTSTMLFSQKLHSEPVMSFDIDVTTNTGASGAADSKICIFNFDVNNKNSTLVKNLDLANPGIQEVKIREDKKIFATAGWDHRVRIYNWKKLTPLAILKGHTEGVYALDFSPMNAPGGALLASASKDKRIALWSIYNKLEPRHSVDLMIVSSTRWYQRLIAPQEEII